MKKLSPQQEIIVLKLRDLKWHCGREWLNEIKDDRARITNLNNFYMAERGYFIKGEPCKGEICGKSKCPLYKRRAEPLNTPPNAQNNPTTKDFPSKAQSLLWAKQDIQFFNNYVPSL